MRDPYIRSAFSIVHSASAWRDALSSLPNPHPLQSWPWADFKSRWGWSATPLLLQIHDEPAGKPPLAAAMVLKRSIPRTAFSILYVPKGPMLDYNNAPLRRVVLAQLEQVARQDKAVFIKIDPDVISAWGQDGDRKSPIGAKFVEELEAREWRLSQDQVQFRNTIELDLDRDEEDILASMKQKTRYNIRLATQKGVVVRRGNPTDFATIVEIYAETASRDGFTIRPVEYYLDAWQTMYDAGMAQPFIAEFEGEILGAVIVVHYGGRALYMYGASTGKERRRMPNHLLQWEAIRWAKASGCKVYDFWGAPDEFDEADSLWGVWRFKAGFNGQVIHHIGAWDYPARPFLYWVYTVVIPKYLNFIRTRGENQTST
ncbi:MAG: peptidoglycan bridge formation glycyltransferase FemA/FemB family protein [Candidatus Promineifilaceae bacterium]